MGILRAYAINLGLDFLNYIKLYDSLSDKKDKDYYYIDRSDLPPIPSKGFEIPLNKKGERENRVIYYFSPGYPFIKIT